MHRYFIFIQLCFSYVSSQWYDPWSVVNQLNLQNSLEAAETYIQEIENQAINNSNTALKLVIAKATEAQQVYNFKVFKNLIQYILGDSNSPHTYRLHG